VGGHVCALDMAGERAAMELDLRRPCLPFY